MASISDNGLGGLNRNSTYVIMVTLNANVYVGIVQDALSAKFAREAIKAQKILAKITHTAQFWLTKTAKAHPI